MPIDEKKIRDELSTLPENFIILFLTEAEKYNELNNFILKYLLLNKKMGGIYITVNKTSDIIKENMNRMGINTDGIFFIDCAKGAISKKRGHPEGSLFVSSPENLTDIGLILTENVKSRNVANTFLLLDSVSTLLLFNSVKSVVKFSHFLVNMMREHKLNGVILAMEKETDEFLRRNLYVFSDKVIEV
jgi:hypothetical protein